MSVQEFDACSPWEFAAQVEGYNRHNGGDDKPAPMTPEQFDELVAKRATAKAAKGLH